MQQIKKEPYSKERGLGVAGMPGKYSAGVFYLNKEASTAPKRFEGGKGGKKKKDGFSIKVPGMT